MAIDSLRLATDSHQWLLINVYLMVVKWALLMAKELLLMASYSHESASQQADRAFTYNVRWGARGGVQEVCFYFLESEKKLLDHPKPL